MDFPVPGFDELFNTILTDYRNQFDGQCDTSEGSLIFIKSACLASALWGIYQHQVYVEKQIFPDTCNEQNLEHHAWVFGVDRKPGEAADDLLARLLGRLRIPPAGGNRYDYESWAMEVAGVKKAYCYPLAQGIGTIDLVIVADAVLTGSEIPSQELIDTVKDYIDDLRPAGAGLFRVLAPSIVLQDVTMAVFGEANTSQVAADITAYIDTFIPGQVLYPSKLAALAISAGADDALVTLPAAAVTPQPGEMLRPGVINVV